MTTKKMQNDDAALGRWAEYPLLRGNAAAAYGRGVLEAAGVDVAAVERAVGGPTSRRPDSMPSGVRSPRVNGSISMTQHQLLDQLARDRGRSRSDVVREALDTYLSHAV